MWTTARNLRRLPPLLCALLLLCAPGCGPDLPGTRIESPEAGGVDPPQKPKKAQPPPEAQPQIPEGWKQVRPYFLRFLDQSLSEFKDPFAPQVLGFVDRDKVLGEMERTLGAQTAGPSGEDEVSELPKGPLQEYPLAAYQPIIIQSGVSEPKAVIQAPGGATYTVRRDDFVGSEGGYVMDIGQYEVVFKLPDQEQPVVRSLKPALIEQAEQRFEQQLMLVPTRR